MRIALVNPYSAGSHAQWAAGLCRELPLAGNRAGVDVEIGLVDLPGRHWKWRMHAAALVLVERMLEMPWFRKGVDAFIVTDMLDVGQFRAALPAAHRSTPIILYFHENQLTFPEHPERPAREWDRHYAFLNVTGALLADAVWFNSAYHRELFLAALPRFIAAFPAPRPVDSAKRIADKSRVVPIGIEDDVRWMEGDIRPDRFGPGPPVVVWNHRWEYDKGPQAFLSCLDAAVEQGVGFRLAVMGQRFDEVPEAFSVMQERHGSRIVHWGHVETRAEYVGVLQASDIALVTAHHDFFGISVLEAALAGLTVIAPHDLAYPEHFLEGELHERKALTRAFVDALRHDRLLPMRMRSRYNWTSIADDILKLMTA